MDMEPMMGWGRVEWCGLGGRVNGWVGGWVGGWMGGDLRVVDGWMGGWVDGRMGRWVDG